jgi:hypothetical protein
MRIFITPKDIIERCLWCNYKRFILKEKDETVLRDIIEKNEEHEINENDAYVIGLLKYIKTENLIHRFKIEIEEMVKIKSTIIKLEPKDMVMVNKNVIIKDINDFRTRFPNYDTMDATYKNAVDELSNFIDKLLLDISLIQTREMFIKDKKYTYIQSNDVNKLIKI